MIKEDRIKKLLMKVEKVDTRSRKELMTELRQKLKELQTKKLFPKNYKKTIEEKLGITDPNKVYHTIAGRNGDLDIAEALIELALEKKREERLIEKANEALGIEDDTAK